MSANLPMSRREALRVLGAGAVVAGLAAVTGKSFAADAAPAAPAATPTGALGWDLPPLGFAFAALEPHIDAKTMEIHHDKHHQAYITNAKNLLKDHADLLARGPEALVRDLASVPEAIRPGIRNNAGGHVNHSFFWKLLSPSPSTVMSSNSRLSLAFVSEFGFDFNEFKNRFADVAMKRFGSGWTWLSVNSDGKLFLHSTANQDSPLSDGAHPIIGLDVWEHAYYLHYQNRRADYVAAFWNVLNWSQAEANYAAALKA